MLFDTLIYNQQLSKKVLPLSRWSECYVLGSYSETLNTSSKIFEIAAADKVKHWAGVSQMRLQQTRLDHDNDFIYLYLTLVEQADKIRK